MEKKDFTNRLAKLRQNKGISARDMSLSLGQSQGYINNIENGINFPSFPNFFYICEFLDVTPSEFFDTQSHNPTKLNELMEAAKGLSNEQLDSIITIIKSMKK